METGYFFSPNDSLKLKTRWWRSEQPLSEDKFVLVIAHGLGEHGKRYERLVPTILGLGGAVYTMDHRGHGESSDQDGTKCFFPDFDIIVNDFSFYLRAVVCAYEEGTEDVGKFMNSLETGGHSVVEGAWSRIQMKAKEAGSYSLLPKVFVMGHSMGGLVAASTAQFKFPSYILPTDPPQNLIRGLLLSAPLLEVGTGTPPFLQKAMKTLGPVIPKKMKLVKVDESAITRDKKELATLKEDPLRVKGNIPLASGMALGAAIDKLAPLAHKNPEKFSLAADSLFVIHGLKDTLTHPEASKAYVTNCAQPSNITGVFVEEGYHELMYDLPEASGQFFDSLTKYLKEQIS